MKQIVLGMIKYSICILFCCLGSLAFSQNRSEREHRIRKSQFPSPQTDISIIGNKNLKRVQYYREIDSDVETYSQKFKLNRLHYHLDFDSEGYLKNSGFQVQEIDLPDDTYSAIMDHLKSNFEKIKVKQIFQEYPVTTDEKEKSTTIKNTLQNLLLPNNLYKLLVRGKQMDKIGDFELWFDAEGKFVRMRDALPANFDRVLY